MAKTTAQVSVSALPGTVGRFSPWATVTISAALLGCIGGVFGATLLFGVIYSRISGWRGPIPLDAYFTLNLRDIAESMAVALFVLWGYRRLPAMHEAMQSNAGVLRVAAIVGSLKLIVIRMLVSKTVFAVDAPMLLAWLLNMFCIALPIVWTIGQRAPDATVRTSRTRLTDREFFKTSVGLFLTVSCLAFMHWVMYADTVFNFFGIIVIPVTAVFLGIGIRQLLGGVARKLEWRAPANALTMAAILVAMGVLIYHLFFSHPPRRW
jgi:hypothetical protein